MKKKMNLRNLEVNSFITVEGERTSKTIVGGRPLTYWGGCIPESDPDTACCSKGTPYCDSNVG